jgi:hypothetical protein
LFLKAFKGWKRIEKYGDATPIHFTSLNLLRSLLSISLKITFQEGGAV